MAPIRSFVAVVLALLAVTAITAPSIQAQSTSDSVLVLTIDGAITPVTAGYVERGIREAERQQLRAVVIQMDTPGGLDSAMRDIIRRILSSEVPVMTYVSPSGARAASAGTFISYAAHVAAMAPSTSIGSASPVSIGTGGEQPQSETMTKKVTNDAVSLIRGLADRRGRNADWAEQAVREAANLTAQDALNQHVIDIVAVDLQDLLQQADGRQVDVAGATVTVRTEGAALRTFEPSLIERFLQLIADPTLAYILLSLAMLGLYLEFANPGSIMPGVTGAILLVLALFALGMLPVNWAGVFLIVLAFALFAAEVWVTSSGVLAVGGLVAFVLGSLLLINTEEAPALQVSPAAIIAVGGTVGLLTLFITSTAVRDRFRRPLTGQEALIGALAITRTPLNPDGMVFIEGERWRAISQAGAVPPGKPVRIVQVRGLDLLVEPADQMITKSERSSTSG